VKRTTALESACKIGSSGLRSGGGHGAFGRVRGSHARPTLRTQQGSWSVTGDPSPPGRRGADACCGIVGGLLILPIGVARTGNGRGLQRLRGAVGRGGRSHPAYPAGRAG